MGGIEAVTEAISEMLPPHGVTADVLAVGLDARGDVTRPGYRVYRMDPDIVVGRNKALSARYLKAVQALEADYDVALLHLPNPLGELATLWGWRKPLVLAWHADFSLRGLRWLGDRLDARIVGRADAVIGATHVHLAESRLACRFVSKGIVIPYPTMPRGAVIGSAKDAVVERVDRWLAGRPMVIAIGRLVHYKGFSVLLEAMRQMRPDVACVIVGDGPLAGDLKSQVAGKLDDRVMLTGAVSPMVKSRLLDMSHIGCMPSITNQEMYGISQVEMMEAGRPVVSTRLARSGVPEVNRDGVTGLLVPPADAPALAAAIDRLVSDRTLYARLAKGAATEFADRHSMSTVAARYADLLRRVAAGTFVGGQFDR